jgi:DNA gyrase subunit B
LLELGRQDAVFDPGDGRLIQGSEMARLSTTLTALEESLVALERRGISLKRHALRQDPVTGRLPVYHVFLGTQEYWFSTREELDKFVAEEEGKGKELTVADKPRAKDGPTETNGAAAAGGNGEASHRLHIVELHEVRSINKALTELSAMGFDIQALIPQERTGTEESRYVLRRGESEIGIEDLRGLLAAVRAAGERGLTITRFKGLGEMNAEELRDTTLNPEHRTLLQVRMEDVSGADELFRVLMGDKVEPRREFIEKHALEVRNLDV